MPSIYMMCDRYYCALFLCFVSICALSFPVTATTCTAGNHVASGAQRTTHIRGPHDGVDSAGLRTRRCACCARATRYVPHFPVCMIEAWMRVDMQIWSLFDVALGIDMR